MQKVLFFFGLISIFLSCQNAENVSNETQSEKILKNGIWKGEFQLHQYTLPFYFKIDSDQLVAVYNDKEIVDMKQTTVENDSIYVEFINFPSSFKFQPSSDSQLSGYFQNLDLGKDHKIAFQATYFGEKLPDEAAADIEYNVAGNWEVYFRPGTDRTFPAVGKFEQNGNFVRGTFLKRSGDSRFLSGTIENDVLLLHSFDGSNPVLFRAKIEGDSLFGEQFTSKETITKWIGNKNADFKLENADSLTFLVENNFEVPLKTLEGEDFVLSATTSPGKVKIVQIMGTWCPNCLDETVFFNELYEKYNDKGLDIYAVAYEIPETFEEQANRVRRLIESRNIPYPILIGGNVKEGKATEDFKMLNKVSAFPTALFFDREGEIAKIQTGFNGPGTGKIYEDYRQETMRFIEELLGE